MALPSGSIWRDKPLERVIAGAVMVWVVLVFAHYFSPSKAVDFSFLVHVLKGYRLIHLDKLIANWLGSLGIFLAAGTILFILWRLGRKGLLWLGLKVDSIPVRLSLEMALGILFTNALWLGLGLNGLWFGPLLGVFGLVSLGWALMDFYRNYLNFQKFPRLEPPKRGYAVLAGMGLFALFLSIGHGLLPETYFDGLVYHLATLSFWKFHHGIADFYTNLYSYFPFGGELYFANGFFLQGTETAKMLNAIVLGLCGLAAGGFAAEEAGMARGILAWAMVLLFPLASSAVWTTQNDVVLSFFLVLFFYAMVRWSREKQDWKWALVAGLLGNGALSVKYTAIIPIWAGLLALGLVQIEAFHPRHWGRWGLIKTLAVLGLVPWLLRNWAYAGNPLYPYLSSWLGGRPFPAERMAALMNDHESVLRAGFSVEGWANQWFNHELNFSTAPLLFAFIPFLLLPGKWGPTFKYLGLLSLFCFLGLGLLSYQPRLLLPAFVIFFLLVAVTLGNLKKTGWTVVWAVAVGVAGWFNLLALGRLTVNYFNADQVWLGELTRAEYRFSPTSMGAYMELTQAADSMLPPGDRLLVVGDSRSLYYPRSFLANSVFDPQVLEVLVKRAKDGKEIWQGLRKLGVDDLVVSGEEGMRVAGQYKLYSFRTEEWKRLYDFVQTWTDLVCQRGTSGIYRLRSGPAEGRSPIPVLLGAFCTIHDMDPISR